MGTRRVKKGVSAALALVLTVGLMPAMPTIALADENAAAVTTERSTEAQETATPNAASAREMTFTGVGDGSAANPYQVGTANELADVINNSTENSEIHVKMTTSVSEVGLLNVSNGKFDSQPV